MDGAIPHLRLVRSENGNVNEFLVVYLDSVDERLLDYLDEDEELRLDTVRRMRFYATALLDGSITPGALAEDWPEFFDLAPAFTAAYTPELAEAEVKARFLEVAEVDEHTVLSGADVAYLSALEERLDMYPEMRMGEEE